MKNYHQMRNNMEYLPSYLRDFHHQKDFFKTLFYLYCDEQKKLGKAVPSHLNWQNFHVFSIDFLLHLLVPYGYLLCKSRKHLNFLNYDDINNALIKHESNLFSNMFKKDNVEPSVAPSFEIPQDVIQWIDKKEHLPQIFKNIRTRRIYLGFLYKSVDLSNNLTLSKMSLSDISDYCDIFLSEMPKVGYNIRKTSKDGNFKDIQTSVLAASDQISINDLI